MNPDDVLAVLTARPFLPFDVELTGGATYRVTDAKTVALVQLEVGDDIDANLAKAAAMADEAARDADLVVLPEYVQFRGSDEGYRASARPIPGPTTAPFAEVARRHGTWILAGTHAERSDDPRRPYNTAVLFDRKGRLAATYRKLGAGTRTAAVERGRELGLLPT